MSLVPMLRGYTKVSLSSNMKFFLWGWEVLWDSWRVKKKQQNSGLQLLASGCRRTPCGGFSFIPWFFMSEAFSSSLQLHTKYWVYSLHIALTRRWGTTLCRIIDTLRLASLWNPKPETQTSSSYCLSHLSRHLDSPPPPPPPHPPTPHPPPPPPPPHPPTPPTPPPPHPTPHMIWVLQRPICWHI